MTITLEVIAATCHEINRTYAEALGEKQPRWESLDDRKRDGVKDGVLYLLNNPPATAHDAHVNWCRWMIENGWCEGATLDEKAKRHPCLIEWESLPSHQRAKDELFVATVRGLQRLANQSGR